MQTTKYLFTAGVLTALILPLQVQGGPDNEEQAKMREALRRALQPSQSQPAPSAQPAAAATPAAQPVATPPPQQQPPPVPVTPVAPPPAQPTVVVQTPAYSESVPTADPESMARAREAMRQKLKELESTPAPAPAVTPEPPKPTVAVAPPPPASTPEPAPKPVAKPAQNLAPVATSTYKPIEAPASPFSSAKQAKLSELLARYRADAITAQEYHAQRAAIIAEP
jgi:hypothetical protein